MILFTILMIVLLLLAVVAIAVISIGGAGFIIIFGDVIVCMAIIIWFIKKKFFS